MSTAAAATAVNLADVQERLFRLRWLTGDGGYTPVTGIPTQSVAVGGAERAVLAHVLGRDVPDLIAQVESLRVRAELAEGERDALRQAIAVRTPARCDSTPKSKGARA